MLWKKKKKKKIYRVSSTHVSTMYSYSELEIEVVKLPVSLNYFVDSGLEWFYSPLHKHISTAFNSQNTTD